MHSHSSDLFFTQIDGNIVEITKKLKNNLDLDIHFLSS